MFVTEPSHIGRGYLRTLVSKERSSFSARVQDVEKA